jgi:predicted RNA binding protein YcfA (HicA-like mRNA interferase family)
MGKLSAISCRDAQRAFTRAGFQFISQKGSHLKFRRIRSDGRVDTIILPNHKTLKEGTLKKGILRPIGMTVDEFLHWLRP